MNMRDYPTLALKTPIKENEQRLYCCSTFHTHSSFVCLPGTNSKERLWETFKANCLRLPGLCWKQLADGDGYAKSRHGTRPSSSEHDKTKYTISTGIHYIDSNTYIYYRKYFLIVNRSYKCQGSYNRTFTGL